MAETPEQRLDRLRREVMSEVAAGRPAAAPIAPASAIPPASATPSASATPAAEARPAAATPDTDADDPDPWSMREVVGEAGIGMWVGVGLVGVGAYLLLARAVPGLSLLGSAALLAAGVGMLALHITGRATAWALYAGAVLTGVGGSRLTGELVPIDLDGLTSLGIGGAFLVIAWLRHGQAGGYGWQGVLGVAIGGYGLLQVGVSLLPGSPGPLDLVLPIGLVAVGAVMVTRRVARGAPRAMDAP